MVGAGGQQKKIPPDLRGRRRDRCVETKRDETLGVPTGAGRAGGPVERPKSSKIVRASWGLVGCWSYVVVASSSNTGNLQSTSLRTYRRRTGHGGSFGGSVDGSPDGMVASQATPSISGSRRPSARPSTRPALNSSRGRRPAQTHPGRERRGRPGPSGSCRDPTCGTVP